jgi:hypothetical protein
MEDGEKVRSEAVDDMKVGKELRERRRRRRELKMVRCDAGGYLRARQKESERRKGRACRMSLEVEKVRVGDVVGFDEGGKERGGVGCRVL